jgi:carbon-monoxide dehydrogenase medium subunit
MVRPFPWSDVIPILSVLDTTVSYYHRDGEGRRNLEDLYKSDFRATLNRSIIKEITISLPEKGKTAAKFIKFSRSEFDVSALNLACRLTVKRGTITEAKLNIGARPMTGERITDLEEELVGEKLTEDLAEAAGVSAADLAALGGDDRLSEEYRKELVKKMTAEALMDIKKEVANES